MELNEEEKFWDYFYQQKERGYREGYVHGWISGLTDALRLWGQDIGEVRQKAQAFIQGELKPWGYKTKEDSLLFPPDLAPRPWHKTEDSNT